MMRGSIEDGSIGGGSSGTDGLGGMLGWRGMVMCGGDVSTILVNDTTTTTTVHHTVDIGF